MPHLLIEFTDKLDVAPTHRLANHALLWTGEFGEADLKSRCSELDACLHGVEARRSVFVHATLFRQSNRIAVS